MFLIRIVICFYTFTHTDVSIVFTDNSERSFLKELKKVIDLSDVVLEVLDARDPLGTRCTSIEEMVAKAGPNKHRVLILNKIGKLSTKVSARSTLVSLD